MIRKLIKMESFPAHALYIFLFSLSAGTFGQFWSAVHSHPALLEPPYSRFIKPGTDGPFILSLVCLAWEILTWIPHESGWKSTRVWWAIISTVRAIVIASFAVFTALQAQYLPLPLGSCANEYEWPDTFDVPKGTPTMWEVLPLSSTTLRSGHSALVMPCAVLNRLRVFEFVLIGFLAVSLVESTVIFIRLPSVASEMPETSSWLRTLHHAIMIPFRVLFYLFSRLGAQQKTALYPEDEMEPLASSTDIQEPKHSHKRHCAEEEDGIRVRPMPEFIGNERPPDY
ncbi:hypothetical protein N7450_011324 [Penicillium hetheringtonii]|uniref:Uncharacterized protein n=1 Tax=Penicillium hetheringtonii TaxID=911720 RepID=A0AAD6DA19_9EURO|nr:hypothetical protein N7450_011324 [Penicillium hetheringtonii]